ncbi:hypothetical protein BRARA_B02460, partial [Brassica rapa]
MKARLEESSWNEVMLEKRRNPRAHKVFEEIGDTTFIINYDGKFENLEEGLTYVEGKIHYQIVDMYGQRVWYKLPNERLSDLKVLCDGGRNEAQENPESDPHEEVVEEIVPGFVDEEEDNEALRDTPPASDDEDDIKPRYERWQRGSGEVKIMHVFESIKEFKEVVLEYALMGGWNVKYTRWGNDISEAKCVVVGEVRHDNALMPRAIQDIIQERYNLTVTHDIARKAWKRALDMTSEESNPESTVDLVTTIRDDGVEIFDKFYVSYCRPIFWIDGCFMKSTSKGKLLAAVGRDATNQIYHVAWGIVQVEDADNWKWSIQRVKSDLELKMGNIKKLHPNKPKFKNLFWAVANSFNEGDYKAALKELKAFDSQIYDDLMVRDPTSCTRAFFSTTSSCEDGLNNFSESYKSGLKKARSLLLVGILETMRRQAMVRLEVTKKKLVKYKAKYSLKIAKTIAEETKKIANEVEENSTSHTFNMDRRTCTCRRWDLTGIPCRHALKLIQDKKLNTENFVADCYLTTLWKQQYSDSITPVEGMKFWKEAYGSQIQPPARPAEKGRKKSSYESLTKGKKVSKHLKTIHCYRCGFPGHNSLHCKNDA